MDSLSDKYRQAYLSTNDKVGPSHIDHESKNLIRSVLLSFLMPENYIISTGFGRLYIYGLMASLHHTTSSSPSAGT